MLHEDISSALTSAGLVLSVVITVHHAGPSTPPVSSPQYACTARRCFTSFPAFCLSDKKEDIRRGDDGGRHDSLGGFIIHGPVWANYLGVGGGLSELVSRCHISS